MNDELTQNLGPPAPPTGIWEGNEGDDVAPDENPSEKEKNQYRERLTLDPFGPVNNHAQTLYGLKYSTTAWRIGSEDPFHTKHFKAGLKGVT